MSERPELEDISERRVSTAELAQAGENPQNDDTVQPADRADQPHSEAAADAQPALFPEGDAEGLRSRWEAIQGSFVDQPRRAVEEADALVAGAMKQLAEIFAHERDELEHQWDRGDDVSTEDLRLVLQRYRSFFSRLLAV